MATQELRITTDHPLERNCDDAKAEAFAGKMIDTFNSGALALMTSLGHRTGLFDAMSNLPAATSVEIARAAELDERYVREWLGAMTVGRVVEHDEHDDTYRLPPEHAAWLTRAATPNNMAASAQFIPLLGAVEDEIVKCFYRGGVPYSAYPRFHQVMAEESGQTVVARLVDTILPLAPGLVERLHRGINVLDIGCGSGRALVTVAESFPASRFVGCDLSEEAIGRGRTEAQARNLSNVSFELKDAAQLDVVFGFDLVTAFDAIHDQAQPAEVLRRISDALRPDGVFLMQDIRGSSHVDKNFDVPLATLRYTISCMHCMTVSLAQGGSGLGAMWGEEQALRMLADAGFGRVDVRQLPHDIINSYYVAAKG